MKLRSERGDEIDAELDVFITDIGIDVVLHAKTGSRAGVGGRNTAYNEALERLLTQMSSVGTVHLVEVAVVSSVALRLEPAERVVALDYPVALSPTTDCVSLRIEVTERQRLIASTVKEGEPGGNKHKRIRLSFACGSPNDGLLANLLDHPTDQTSSANPGEGVGLPYRSAGEVGSDVASVWHQTSGDLHTQARRRHAGLQNQVAQELLDRGLDPRSPLSREPQFDLAWVLVETLFVAEVKSLESSNLTSQMRTGVGQVLEYRQKLSVSQELVVVPCLIVECDPGEVWKAICCDAGIELLVPPLAERIEQLCSMRTS